MATVNFVAVFIVLNLFSDTYGKLKVLQILTNFSTHSVFIQLSFHRTHNEYAESKTLASELHSVNRTWCCLTASKDPSIPTL